MMESKSISGTTIVYIVCTATVFLFLEIVLGCYLYSVLNSNFHESLVKEVTNGVCRDEFRRILKDPLFASYLAEAAGNKKKIETSQPYGPNPVNNDDSWIRLTDSSRIPGVEMLLHIKISHDLQLESLQEFCKATVDYCPDQSSTRTGRFTRSISGNQVNVMDYRNTKGLSGRTDKIIYINTIGKPGVAGPPGEKGSRGEDGYLGPPGMKGDPGPPGLPGEMGRYGLIGPPGREGPKGDKGSSNCPKGHMGITGPVGLQGEKGDSGPKGDKGETGPRGPPPVGNGPKGEKGEPGYPAPYCKPGVSGMKGDKGEPGRPGAIGVLSTTPKPRREGYADRERMNWKATKYGDGEYPGLPSRTAQCVLQTIKDPKSLAFIIDDNGSWMVDSYPPEEADVGKTWVTTSDENDILFEYHDMSSSEPDNTYVLNPTFEGNGHVIYNGSFFFQPTGGMPLIVNYPITNKLNKSLEVPGLTPENLKLLYSTKGSYLDLSVDENGLWVIFSVPETNNTGVMKVDVDTMTPQFIWNITVDHFMFTEMFVASGMLYGVDDIVGEDIRISHVMDLYTEKHHEVDIDIIQKFGNPSMAAYDFRAKQLMTWNKGWLMYSPVTCEPLESNETEAHPE